MKKILLLVAIILTFSNAAFATFSDMPNDEIYKTAINKLVDEKVINGYEDNTFRPELKITRAEFAKMIVTATDISETTNNSFTDVPDDHWAKEFIQSIYASKLVEGYEDGSFKPEKNITYAEVATVLVRSMGLENDAKESELVWPQNYIAVAEKYDLFKGWRTNDLIADNAATRANTALMIYNMLNTKEPIKEESNSNKVDTKTAYAGFVISRKEKAGIRYITVDTEQEKIEYALSKKTDFPTIGSFIIYQLNSDSELKLRQEILLSAKDDVNTLIVSSAKNEVIKFENSSENLHLRRSSYMINDKEIKLDKYNYFILNIKNDEFTSFELLSGVENLKIKKADRIYFDKTLNTCYIFREN